MILIVGASPALQYRMCFDDIKHGNVNRAKTVEVLASGKGPNVARVCSRLKVRHRLLLFLGGSSGNTFRSHLNSERITYSAIPTRSSTRTCVTVVNSSKTQTTELVENAPEVSRQELDKFEQLFQRELPRTRILILTGSLPHGIPDSFYSKLIAKARLFHIPVILDCQKSLLTCSLQEKPFLVKPNREELAATTGINTRSKAGLEKAIYRLHEAGAHWVVITDGPHPLYFSENGKNIQYLSIPKARTLNNPIGCGDALTAGCAFKLFLGKSVPESLLFGISCSIKNISGTGYGRI